jgi:hypothetical protein
MAEGYPQKSPEVDPNDHFTWPVEVSEHRRTRPYIRIAPDGRRVWLLSDEAFDELKGLIEGGDSTGDSPTES